MKRVIYRLNNDNKVGENHLNPVHTVLLACFQRISLILEIEATL